MDEKLIAARLSEARILLLKDYPFFGRLLMNLRFGLADCGTAFTDMTRIVFDPDFAARLSEDGIICVLIHEVLHCVLKHCTRGRGKHHFIYNLACDIVVNSVILDMLGKDDIKVDNVSLMHLAPDGTEGRDNTAEEIYDMLIHMTPEQVEGFCEGGIDDHSVWNGIEGQMWEEIWEERIRKASQHCGRGSGIPDYIARHLTEIDRNPRVNWRQVIHDFIQFDRNDFDFKRPDRRYMPGLFMPSYRENVDGCRVDDLWFLVDTSGSVSDGALSVAYSEICQAIEQIGSLNGILSFFDEEVSAPIPFESVEDIISIKPIGGGGTSFEAIFDKLGELVSIGEAPGLMIIITDGYSTFPDEERALGIPVMWIIVDSDVTPTFGEYTFITT